jgi:acyl-coenzyme A thioesterase PaaI-like protein
MAVDGFNDPLTRHFGYRSLRHDVLRASSWIDLRPDLLDEAGRIQLGVLAFLVDSTAGVACGMAAVPAWVITSDLQFRVVAMPKVGPMRADAHAVQPGKRQSLGDVRVFDEGDGDRVVAIGTVNHVVIQRDGALDVPSDMPIGIEYASGRDVDGHAPLMEHFSVSERERGVVELPIEGDAVNHLGILHGGLISLLVEQASRSALGHWDHEVTDMVVRFLRGLKDTSATATAIIEPAADRLLARVEVRDKSGALGALASTGMRRTAGAD